MRTDPLRQLFGRKQAIGFNDGSLAMDPLRLDGTPPGVFRREPKGQDAHTFACLFDLLMVFSDPGPHDLAEMPGRISLDQQPGARALLCQPLAAPVEKLGGDVAHRALGNKAQPHLVAHRANDGDGLRLSSARRRSAGGSIMLCEFAQKWERCKFSQECAGFPSGTTG
jgi:hypothetical protein